mmetsp:Transcript_17333/g.51777  ORF Transcript_17333/g.51777 Transcript_17333/m.51777 type:complete len:342 (+) Transcript_17333:168-1193(+)
MKNDILHSGEDETDIIRIGSTCDVRIDVFLVCAVEVFKLCSDVLSGRFVVATTIIVGERNLKIMFLDLLLEQITLVQEENNRCACEPSTVADFVEQLQRFMHTVDSLIFIQSLVVLTEGHEENHSSHVLETMNPLLSLTTLATHIDHLEVCVVNRKISLRNTSCLGTRTQNILFSRNKVRVRIFVNLLNEVFGRVTKLKLIGTSVHLLNTFVRPKLLDFSSHLRINYLCTNRIMERTELFRKFLILFFEGNLKTLRSQKKGTHVHQNVRVNNVHKLLLFFRVKTSQVDNLHLFGKCALSRFTSTKEQEFHLMLELLSILSELLLDGTLLCKVFLGNRFLTR